MRQGSRVRSTTGFGGTVGTRIVIAAALSALLVVWPVSATMAGEIGELTPGLESPSDYRVSSGETAPLTSASGVLPAAGVFESERAMILQQTNSLRAANDLPPLRLNSALNDIAQDWSTQQARVSAMSHREGFYLLYPSGWSRASENVAAGFSPSAVVGAWANSPGHRANLLSNNTDIGIGIAMNSSGRLYYTQNFGRYTTPPPTPPGAVSRIAGNDRFATSAQISARTFPGGARTVYVASGFDFPDALSAAALAGAADGPLLLVSTTSVPSVILTELRRLDPDRIVVAGGPGVIADAVLTTLRTVTSDVDRIFGSNRFETSRKLALDAYRVSGSATVYLATGLDFADALAAGPAAAAVNAPVVLVNGALPLLDPETLDLLDTLGTDQVVITGGIGAVSAGIEQDLRDAGLQVTRFAGSDRFDTAAQIAADSFPDAPRSYIATGTGFADALSGGAAAGALGAPLFTVRTGCVTTGAHTALRNQDPDDIVLLGGLSVLTPVVAGFYRC